MRPPTLPRAAPRRSLASPPRASDGGGGGAGNDAPPPPPRVSRRRRRSRKAEEAPPLSLDTFNPYAMGRKSRQLFDDVWTQFTKLGSPVTSSMDDGGLPPWAAASGEFETPTAAATTRVLVVGATGRVGRVLVRKLLLRGYRVTALVRPPAGTEAGAVPPPDAADAAGLPPAARVAYGDVGDYASLLAAVADADKVVYAATARTTVAVDVGRVDAEGPALAARALQDTRNAAGRRAATGGGPPLSAKVTVAERAHFERDWAVEHCGPEPSAARGGPRRAAAVDRAAASLNDRRNLVFEGTVRSRGGYAQVGAPLPGGPGSLAGCDGLVVRVAGDGNTYTVVAATASGALYGARVATPLAFVNLRLPFNSFRPLSAGAPPALDPAAVERVALRFAPPPAGPGGAAPAPSSSAAGAAVGGFRLEVDRIKALPGGAEPDFVLVSCTGAAAAAAAAAAGEGDGGADTAERVLAAKRAGEAALRRTGLGYVIVRPGPLVEEPGGYRALVFDQGRRLTSPLSCADAADVCLKALHDPVARNKAFDVAYEAVGPDGLANFELVAHLPDKANNYLSPALAVLEKNT